MPKLDYVGLFMFCNNYRSSFFWLCRFREFIPLLLQYVLSRQMADKPVLWVAHNGRSFDVPFLMYEFQRSKIEMPGDWLFVDTLPIARQLIDSDGTFFCQVFCLLA